MRETRIDIGRSGHRSGCLAERRGQPPKEFERVLREAALRVTRARVTVLAAVDAHPHADTTSIIRAARTDLGKVSHQAVYDVLQALTNAGLVRRIQPSGSVARYESRVGDNHHHLVCSSCGAIVDVDCAVGDTPCLTPSAALGFVVEWAEVTYWGMCPNCAALSNAPQYVLSSSQKAQGKSHV